MKLRKLYLLKVYMSFFLTLTQIVFEGIKKSFENVQWDAKIYAFHSSHFETVTALVNFLVFPLATHS